MGYGGDGPLHAALPKAEKKQHLLVPPQLSKTGSTEECTHNTLGSMYTGLHAAIQGYRVQGLGSRTW